MTDVAGTYPFGRAEAHPRTAHIVGDPVNQQEVARAERATASAVKHVVLRVDRSQMREVHRELAQRLARQAGVRVSLARVGRRYLFPHRWLCCCNSSGLPFASSAASSGMR